jgi:hypothetical protein
VSDRWNQAKAGLELARQLAREAAKRAVSAAQEALSPDAGPQAPPTTLEKTSPAHLQETAPEPPVVARLMIEIRSDGSRTIARGALQDELSGEQVAIEAKGNSPLELAAQLAKSLVTAPMGLGALGKALLSNNKKP